MTKYWALDYVDETECELVVNGQLYATEYEAEMARLKTDDPEHYEVTWYTKSDLENEVYNVEIGIDEDLRVHPYEW